MARVDVYNRDRQKVGDLELDDAVFGVEVREHLYYEVVRMQMANRRSGTAHTKDRGEVKYSTHKLYRQKGTGRARRGSRRSPILRGGGTTFGPKRRSFAYRVPRTMRKAALRSALSGRAGEGQLYVLDSLSMANPKTKDVQSILSKFGIVKALVIDSSENQNLRLSTRNLPNAKFVSPAGVNVYDVLHFHSLVLTQDAVREIEGALKK